MSIDITRAIFYCLLHIKSQIGGYFVTKIQTWRAGRDKSSGRRP